MSVNGFWHAGTDGATPASNNPDEALHAYLGSATDIPVSVATGSAVGSVAYFLQAQQMSYQIFGDVGEIAPFSVTATGDSRVVRGYTANDPYTQITTTSNGTAILATAVSATQTLYANLHVFAASGTTPSLTVKVQSDDAAGFSSPTDRITFTAATGRTTEAKSVAGAITDTYYRVSYTVSGSSPKFLALVTFGII